MSEMWFYSVSPLGFSIVPIGYKRESATSGKGIQGHVHYFRILSGILVKNGTSTLHVGAAAGEGAMLGLLFW
jgi:hypothetical protein